MMRLRTLVNTLPGVVQFAFNKPNKPLPLWATKQNPVSTETQAEDKQKVKTSEDKSERYERYAEQDKLEKGGKSDRNPKFNRGDKHSKFGQQDRQADKQHDKYEKGDRPERQFNKYDRPDRPDRGEGQHRKWDKTERADKSDKYEKSEGNDKGDRYDRGDRPDRGDRQDRSDRGDRPDRAERGLFNKNDGKEFKPRTGGGLFSKKSGNQQTANENEDGEEGPVRQTQQRLWNVILNSKDAKSENDIEQLRKQLLSTPDTVANTGKLIQIHGKLNNLEIVEKMFNKFAGPQFNKFDAQVFQNYLLAICNGQCNREQLNKIMTIVQKHEASIRKFDRQVFRSIYQYIFGLKAFTNEIVKYLEQYYTLLSSMDLQSTIMDLSLFATLVDESTYAKHPKHLKDVARVLNMYLEPYTAQFKGKQLEAFPNLEILFKIAVHQQDGQAEIMLQQLRKLQQSYEKHVRTEDLVKLIAQLATKTGKFPEIIEISRGIKTENVISEIEFELKKLDSKGSPVKCINAAELTKYYVEEKNRLPLKSAELVCLFAERLEEYQIIADLFLHLGKHKQFETSAYIYQKAINTLLELSDGKNASNTIMQLMNEANKAKVPLNKFSYQINQIKALIKENKYEVAFSLFTKDVIEDVIEKFQREKVRRFLYKYIQNHYILNENDFKAHPELLADYVDKIKQLDEYVNAMSAQQLLKFHQEESSDNIIMEALIGQEDIFEYWDKRNEMDLYIQAKVQIMDGSLDFKTLATTTDPELIKQRDIIINYDYHMSLEKQRLIKERKQDRIEQILSQVDDAQFEEMSQQEIMKIVYEHFTHEELEHNLLENDTMEFPELEQVKKIQDYILKNMNNSQSITYKQPEIIQQSVQQEIETIADEILYNDEQEQQQEKQLKSSEQQEQHEEKEEGETETNAVASEAVVGEEDDEFDEDKMISELQEVYDELDEFNKLESAVTDTKEGRNQFIWNNFQLGGGDDTMLDQSSEEETYDMESESEQENEDEDDDEPFDEPTPTLFLSTGVDDKDLAQLKYMFYGSYSQNNYYIRIPPSKYQDEIWDLIAWGIKNKEPLAIRLGEYYSNLTGIKIPQHMCKAIAQIYKFEVGNRNSAIRNKWVHAFQVTGNLDISKVYDHQDNAFISQRDIEILQELETQQKYKGLARSLLKTSYSPNRYTRYGVTARDIIKAYQS